MKIALIGRPNVGKSTLFNRLVGQKNAIVGDMPGITRDRKVVSADFFGIRIQVIDTPGVDTFSKDDLAKSMNLQSFAALSESDVVFFVVDAIEGVTEYDKSVATWLRKSFKQCGNRPVVVIKNKCEKSSTQVDVTQLGFGEGIAISAEHNLGFDGLLNAISDFDFPEEKILGEEEIPLKVAIVGRPNVGKSTLINAIIGENRLLTGDKAGITRDSITLNWNYRGRKIFLIDTAGQRKKSKVQEKIENVSVSDAWRYVKQSHVVVLVMDIRYPLEKQDITIARKAFDEGKIIIFALNKSDIVPNAEEIQKDVERRAKYEFSQLLGVPCLLVSAKEKLGLARIFNKAFELYDKWNIRIPTSALNKWFQWAVEKNHPPLVNGMPIKLKYISQTNTRPPTFAVFANRSEHLPASYEKYLLNNLRKSFDFDGVPLRIFIRQRRNPYVE
ncbi:MAG: ribosome biogenesis GTPase Der [Alphaproteobacteria bacterium]|nr:ribosome biogenesis GTPase Der [Alphaproteobacteria bacterium]